jgi:hypothetical protein
MTFRAHPVLILLGVLHAERLPAGLHSPKFM